MIPHRTWGLPGDAPVILLHGMWGGSRHWEAVGPLLSGGRFVVAPDLPGFTAEGGGRHDYRPARLAEAVSELMDGLGLAKAALVGNSLGGRVAVEVALTAPERVSRLVLVAPAGLTPPVTWLRALPKWKVPLEDGYLDLALAQIFARPLTDPVVAVAAARERRALAGIPFTAFLNGSARCLTEMSRSVPDAESLKSIACPKGLIWGREDRLILLEVAVLLQALWPSSALEVLDGVGHCPNLEAPEAFSDAVDRLLAIVPASSPA